MTCDVDAARTFIYANGRLLEQRVFAALFEGRAASAVVAALAAYRNTDGGFGHGFVHGGICCDPGSGRSRR